MSVTPPGTTRPKVAIAHDYITQTGGAERVVLAMHRAFPDAPVSTTLFDPATTFPEFSEIDVQVSALNRITPLRRHHRLALPVLAPATTRLHVDADVVLCSSSGWAHGVSTSGAKVVYCHTPARWLYVHDQDANTGSSATAARFATRLLGPSLRRWDHRAAASADLYLANSQVVAKRISDIYGVDAEVVHPPVAVDVEGALDALPGVEPGYLLCVARLLAYKNVDAVAEAVASIPGQRLVVVGDGPAADQVRKAAESAGDRISFFPRVSDNELRWLYTNAAGLVCAAADDFGLTPVEAAAFGVPTIGIRANGLIETIVEDETGLFFEEATPTRIAEGVRRLNQTTWDPELLRAHAELYSERSFAQRLRQLVADVAAVSGSAPSPLPGPATIASPRPPVQPVHVPSTAA